MKFIPFIVILQLAGFVLQAQVNLNQGLQLHYSFNGSATDLSGNGNNGIVNGATLVTDRWGNPNGAYRFDGTTNFIEVPNSGTLNFPDNKFTFYALINVEGFYYGTCHGNAILDKGTDFQPGHYGLRFDDNIYTNGQNCANINVDTLHQIFYGLKTSMSTPQIITNQYINKNTWYCLIAVCDSNTIKTYVDGQHVLTSNSTSTVGSNNQNLFIGKTKSIQYPYWFKGVIDEVRMYSRAINMQEVATLCEYSPTPNKLTDPTKPKINRLKPNPAIQQLDIDLSKLAKGARILLYDITGKLVKTFIVNHYLKETLTIDVSQFHPGLYFVKVENDKTTESYKLLIK